MKKLTVSVRPIPIINPIYPKTVVIMIDSRIMVFKMDTGVAPMACGSLSPAYVLLPTPA
jgi:hypothetical protein